MSKERARRREDRQAETAARDAKAAALAERRRRTEASAARRRLLVEGAMGRLPWGSRRGGATGLLAARRRRTTGLVALGFGAIQVLAWAWTPDWGIRVAVFVVCLFALPVIFALG